MTIQPSHEDSLKKNLVFSFALHSIFFIFYTCYHYYANMYRPAIPSTDVKPPLASSINIDIKLTQLPSALPHETPSLRAPTPSKHPQTTTSSSAPSSLQTLAQNNRTKLKSLVQQHAPADNASSISTPATPAKPSTSSPAKASGPSGRTENLFHSVLQGHKKDLILASIQQQLKEHWQLPLELQHQNLNAKIYLKINTDGWVIHKEWVQTSGNKDFDAYVLEAIDNSQPLIWTYLQELKDSDLKTQLDALRLEGFVVGFPI